MSRTFKSLFGLSEAKPLSLILKERRERELVRQRRAIVKRLGPGLIYQKGRLIEE